MKPISYGFLIFPASLLCLGVFSVQADGLVVNDGGTVMVDGGTLDLSCQTITVNNGGSLTLNEGEIDKCQKVEVETGGTYSKVSGKLLCCYGFLPAVFELLLPSE